MCRTGLVNGTFSVSDCNIDPGDDAVLTEIPDIGADNQLKQRSNSNTTGLWSNGPLNDMNITVFDADQVGMQACWYGNAYGDADYVHTDRPSTGSTAASIENGKHISLRD